MNAAFTPGDWVLGLWQGGRWWFPGVVHSIGADGAVAISYDDGTTEIRPAGQVKPYDWTAGSRIDALWSGDGLWYAAVILSADPNGSKLRVRFDDGIEEDTVTGRCRSE